MLKQIDWLQQYTQRELAMLSKEWRAVARESRKDLMSSVTDTGSIETDGEAEARTAGFESASVPDHALRSGIIPRHTQYLAAAPILRLIERHLFLSPRHRLHIPRLPLLDLYFDDCLRIGITLALCDLTIDYKHARLILPTCSLVELFDYKFPELRTWFLGKEGKKASLSSFVGVEGMPGWYEGMPTGSAGFMMIVTARATQRGVKLISPVGAPRNEDDGPPFNQLYFKRPGAGQQVDDCHILHISELEQNERTTIENKIKVHISQGANAEVAVGFPLLEDGIKVPMEYVERMNVPPCTLSESLQADANLDKIFELRQLEKNGAVHSCYSSDARILFAQTPPDIILDYHERKEAEKRQVTVEQYKADIRIIGSILGCSVSGCQYHILNIDKTGLTTTDWHIDLINTKINPNYLTQNAQTVCRKHLLIMTLLTDDEFLWMTPEMAYIEINSPWSRNVQVAATLGSDWTTDCPFAGVGGMTVKQDSLGLAPACCTACYDLMLSIREGFAERVQDVRSTQPDATVAVYFPYGSEIAFCSECPVGAKKDAIVPSLIGRTNQYPQGESLGYSNKDGQPVCKRCFIALGGILTKDQPYEGGVETRYNEGQETLVVDQEEVESVVDEIFKCSMVGKSPHEIQAEMWDKLISLVWNRLSPGKLIPNNSVFEHTLAAIETRTLEKQQTRELLQFLNSDIAQLMEERERMN